MSENPAQKLHQLGQSVWYDNISRDLLINGELKRMVLNWGVRGVTSNPTIFEKAIGSSDIYDSTIAKLSAKKFKTDQIFEELALEDIGEAADVLRPIYDESGGDDGFVSIEVSPLLARDTRKTVEEALRLNERLNRPNIMVKVPGTPEGLPAVRELLERGLNINITLLFSVPNYEAVAKAYCEALSARVSKKLPVDRIRSVASFFVSRVDTSVDDTIQKLISKAGGDHVRVESLKALLGRYGIANSKLAYARFQDIFCGEAFASLKAAGAVAQRPLWASTGVKNPAYRDVMYVEELIGDETVNTMPPATLEAFVDHGVASSTITQGMSDARALDSRLRSEGIDIEGILNDLQVDGVKKFSESFESLNKTLSKKMGLSN